MALESKTQRTCKEGHQYLKSSDCPTCPVCEAQKKPKEGFLSSLSAPARRALENKGILTVKDLSSYTEQDILKLHGMGRASLPALRKALSDEGLGFYSQD